MPSAPFFQGSTVTGPVVESAAQTFEEVIDMLRQPPRLRMTRKAFLAMSKEARAKAKEVPFFVPATFKQSPSPRNYAHAIDSNLIFLDIDPLPDGTCPAAPFVKDPSLLYQRLAGLNFVAYHTASSTPEQPRMRVIVKARDIPISDYPRAVATIAAKLGLTSITSESNVAVQPMYSPTRFADTPEDEPVFIAEWTDGEDFTWSDIPENQGRMPTPKATNGSNGNHADLHAPASVDDLENCVAPDPEYTLEIVKDALASLDASMPRPRWIKLIAAMRHQFSPQQDDEALEVFDAWSQGSESQYPGEMEVAREWNTLHQTPKGRHPVTIRTLVKWAEEAGWVNPIKQAKIDAANKVVSIGGYYDSAKKEFLLRNDGGRWLSHGPDAFKRHLRKMGFTTKVPEGKPLSPAEEIMEAAINQRDVKYAGPLAGRSAGFYEEGGARFLVTESPKLIEPRPGEAPIICGLIHGLVGQGEHGPRQEATTWGWLSTAVKSLRAGERQDAQALALAGPVGCGKSLFQMVVTEILGGRSAKAMRYMSGQTPFNSELFGAEHLMLEDECSSTDIRARMAMAAHIKEITVNSTHSCHAKHREAITLRPLWWMTISLNDEPEAMLVLPPMRGDIVAKIILLQCSAPLTPFPTGSHALHSAYWQSIVAEIPAFIQMLLDYEIPAELRDSRFGIRYFHHPDLVENLHSLAPETKLLELIDRAIFTEQKTPWEGTAGELESKLRSQFSGVSGEADRLFHWNTACGVYLGKLAEKNDGRVKARRSTDKRWWVIQPPSVVEENLDDY